MNKLIAVPGILAVALSLSACNKHDDAATNDTTANEQVLGADGSIDANAIDGNAAAADDGVTATAPSNGTDAAVANTQ